jgi:hypothetical protein
MMLMRIRVDSKVTRGKIDIVSCMLDGMLQK